MTGMILPRRLMEQRQREKAEMARAATPLRHRTNTDDFVTPQEIAEQMAAFKAHDGVVPTAAGWSVMVLMITIPEVTEGGLIMDSDYTDQRTKASPQGVVIGVGDAAYNKKDRRFPSGPWCRTGDRVLYGRYAGKSFQLANGQELAFLSDTDIIATVDSGWLDTEDEGNA